MWSLQILRFLPRTLISHLTGVLVDLRLPEPWRLRSLRWFAQKFNLNLEEAEKPIEAYATVGELFTRRLKPGLRPIGAEPVHPADGQLTACGDVHRGELLQVKGWIYKLDEFVGRTDISQFEGGRFYTYYLCPTDYHRVHSPVSGEIVWARHVPGTLWPVHEHSINTIPCLFVKNERVIVEVKTVKGPVLVVFVGATNVGKMTMSFDKEMGSRQAAGRMKTYNPPVVIEAGAELGVFNMGSTVVVVYPKGYFTNATNHSGPVHMGQSV